MPKDIGIIGGDIRMEYLADIFAKNGWNVKMAGHDDADIYNPDIVYCNEPFDAINSTSISVLGVPSIKDNYIFAPYSERKICLDEIIYSSNAGTKFYGCNVSNDIVKEFNDNKSEYYNYSDNEYFTWMNADVTAECCIGLIITNTNKSLRELSIAVLGYGRIGKLLSKKLSLLNCKPTIFARKDKALAEANALGINSVLVDSFINHADKFDLIINTIPYPIISPEILQRINGTYIELASKPGGIAENNSKTKVINAGGLPGKYAPLTAAKILYNTILRMIGEIKE